MRLHICALGNSLALQSSRSELVKQISCLLLLLYVCAKIARVFPALDIRWIRNVEGMWTRHSIALVTRNLIPLMVANSIAYSLYRCMVFCDVSGFYMLFSVASRSNCNMWRLLVAIGPTCEWSCVCVCVYVEVSLKSDCRSSVFVSRVLLCLRTTNERKVHLTTSGKLLALASSQ